MIFYWSSPEKLGRLIRATPLVEAPVADALATLDRRHFVPGWRSRRRAYLNRSLPIGDGQVIGQPGFIAQMISAARSRPGTRVLEIGTGSGWGAAILARLAREVVSVERIERLARGARIRLAEAGIGNVQVVVGDGSVGDGVRGPFDTIVVSAAAPRVPNELIALLVDGGTMVIPVGDPPSTRPPWDQQQLVRITMTAGKAVSEQLLPCSFVPLVGRAGWPESVVAIRRR